MIKAFPKIFAIGQDYIKDIFNDEVEITEKIDGSQFVFGKIEGELYLRSKGQQIYPETVDKMFKIAVDHVLSIENLLEDGKIYYCEYLSKPKHNTLVYERVPKNNLILFGVCDKSDKFVSRHIELAEYAEKLDIECMPLLYHGKVYKFEEFDEILKSISILGNSEIEGVVVKNYNRPFLLGGQPIPLMSGKYVSEKFKEVHRISWGRDSTTKGKFETFKEAFKTEARWDKAIQHLRDSGNLENSPRDIGKLIKEIQNDITEEEKETIKEFLWKEYGSAILRYSVSGFPEFYKKKLAKESFSQ